MSFFDNFLTFLCLAENRICFQKGLYHMQSQPLFHIQNHQKSLFLAFEIELVRLS